MHPSKPPANRYVSPITADERMATMLLRNLRRMAKLGMGCPISQADLAELEAERDRLRLLRGYTSKKHRSASRKVQRGKWITVQQQQHITHINGRERHHEQVQ